jgi:hypothetical protein
MSMVNYNQVYNVNKNFFEQLPYDMLSYIISLIPKNKKYNDKLYKLNISNINFILDNDKYINNVRIYEFEQLKLNFNFPIKCLIWSLNANNLNNNNANDSLN